MWKTLKRGGLNTPIIQYNTWDKGPLHLTEQTPSTTGGILSTGTDKSCCKVLLRVWRSAAGGLFQRKQWMITALKSHLAASVSQRCWMSWHISVFWYSHFCFWPSYSFFSTGSLGPRMYEITYTLPLIKVQCKKSTSRKLARESSEQSWPLSYKPNTQICSSMWSQFKCLKYQQHLMAPNLTQWSLKVLLPTQMAIPSNFPSVHKVVGFCVKSLHFTVSYLEEFSKLSCNWMSFTISDIEFGNQFWPVTGC